MSLARMHRVRVEVALSGARPPAWQRWLLRQLDAGEHSRVVRITIAPVPSSRPVMWRALDVLDRWRERRRTSALDPSGPPIAPRNDGGEVDVHLDLVGSPEECAAESWRLRVDGDERYGLDAAPLVALATVEGFLGVRVEAVRGEKAWVLAAATAPLDRGSLAADRDAALWKGARLMAYAVRDLARGELARRPVPLTRPLARPGAAAIAVLPRVLAAGVSLKVRDRLTRRQWFIGVRRKRWRTLDEMPGDAWRILRPPPGISWADPFLARCGGRHYLFFEEVAPDELGSIACAELREDLSLGPVRTVIGGTEHVSYPYVFAEDRHMYLVPETSARRTVELWRAVDPPWRWEREAVLLSGVRAVDSTIVRHDGKWWLFTSIAPPHATDREDLYVFWSEDLHGPWRAHARNPIVTDSRWARPAGRPFLDRERLIRPAQDCAVSYGRRIVLRHVEELTMSAYRERTVATIGPTWAKGSIAAHTFDHDDALEVLDGRWMTWRVARSSRAI